MFINRYFKFAETVELSEVMSFKIFVHSYNARIYNLNDI